jgi:hypothetical protein
MVRFYDKTGTAEQWIKDGKQAAKTPPLSCQRVSTAHHVWNMFKHTLCKIAEQ